MIYHQKNNKTKSRRNKIIFIVLFVVILILAGGLIRGLFQITNISIQSVRSVTVSPLQNLFDYFSSKKTLVAENEQLNIENKKLKIELLTLESLRQENSQLKDVLSYENVPNERVLAKVLNKPPFSPFDTFVINQGDSRVVSGSLVYYHNVLIGSVSETYSNTSIIKLNSSPGNEIPIKINGNEATATGQSSGTFEIMLPKDVSVEMGDVVMSGDHVVGVISGIEVESSNTFQNLYFSYPFRLQEIDWVEVNKN